MNGTRKAFRLIVVKHKRQADLFDDAPRYHVIASNRVESAGLPAAEWPWLLGAITAGGIAGPVLLMAGLAHTEAATASLLLNLEAVLTAVIAWLVFHENADRRIVLGMALIVAGGVTLAIPNTSQTTSGLTGPALIASA